MRMKEIAIAAVIALMAAPTPMRASVPAEEYHPGCAAVAAAKQWSEVPPEYREQAKACLGAVAVLLHSGKKRGICPPGPIPQDDAAAVVARHLDANPDAMGQAFRSVAQVALSEEFPCDSQK